MAFVLSVLLLLRTFAIREDVIALAVMLVAVAFMVAAAVLLGAEEHEDDGKVPRDLATREAARQNSVEPSTPTPD